MELVKEISTLIFSPELKTFLLFAAPLVLFWLLGAGGSSSSGPSGPSW